MDAPVQGRVVQETVEGVEEELAEGDGEQGGPQDVQRGRCLYGVSRAEEEVDAGLKGEAECLVAEDEFGGREELGACWKGLGRLRAGVRGEEVAEEEEDGRGEPEGEDGGKDSAGQLNCQRRKGAGEERDEEGYHGINECRQTCSEGWGGACDVMVCEMVDVTPSAPGTWPVSLNLDHPISPPCGSPAGLQGTTPNPEYPESWQSRFDDLLGFHHAGLASHTQVPRPR